MARNSASPGGVWERNVPSRYVISFLPKGIGSRITLLYLIRVSNKRRIPPSAICWCGDGRPRPSKPSAPGPPPHPTRGALGGAGGGGTQAAGERVGGGGARPPPPPKAERPGAPVKPGVGLTGWSSSAAAGGSAHSDFD